MAKKSRIKSLAKKTLLVILTALLILGLLEFTHKINLIADRNQDSLDNGSNDSQRPTNTVDYGPAKPEDTVITPDKNTNPAPTTPESPTITSGLAVTITSSRKSGDYYLIKAVISGSTNASCNVSMTKGSMTVSATSDAANVAGQYSCNDLKIPLSQLLEGGTWKTEVSVKDAGGSIATDSQEVSI